MKRAAALAWEWQKSQSNEFIALEIVGAVALVLLYLLKRHIARRRYLPRLVSYVEGKKRRLKARYDAALAKVYDFNATLASVLPHFVYFSCYFFAPSIYSLFFWL